MGVTIPQPFKSKLTDPVEVQLLSTTIGLNLGPITVNPITLNPISATLTLNPVHVSIDHLPPIEIRLTELPSIRAHLPVDMGVCMSLFGVDLMAIRLCGEAQMITEPYHPNPCERCGNIDHAGAIDVAGTTKA